MAKTIKPSDLGAAIQQELTIYHEEVAEKVNAAGEEAVKSLVEKTKATAPKDTGEFKKRITWTKQPIGNGMHRYVWHVKAPDYRLTHLIVHGHATVNGGRTKGNPFLKNAVDAVIPDYERKVEEAIKNG